MPGFIVHLGAMVQCAHGGVAQPTSVSPRVMVSGQPVVVQTSVYSVAGCAMPPPPSGNGPCVTGQFIIAATRVFASGLPVVLLDSQAICVPTGTPLIISTTQTRVTGT